MVSKYLERESCVCKADYVTTGELSRKNHNLFLKFLLREDEPPHDIIQLLQSKLSVELSHIIRVRPDHPLQTPIQIQ